MPVWLEILVDLAGYAGFIAIASHHHARDAVRGAD